MTDRFSTVRSEGAILPADLLQRIAAGDTALPGLDPASYHLLEGEKLNEAANRAWNRLQSAWTTFRAACERLAPTDRGAPTTRERWLLPLFAELGYGRLQPLKHPFTIGNTAYPISHAWGHVPIHLIGCRMDLDLRAAGSPSPHSLLQEFLNRSDTHVWGFVSNGLKLRILRDNKRLTRQAYVEFDLQAMFEGQVYADFALLWRLCHQSRVEAEKPEDCWLEQWSKLAEQQGLRALDQLRDGVEQAIGILGRGFLACPANQTLRDRLRAGQLDAQDYYRQLLRLVYRLLFLFVAEDRELLLLPQPPNTQPPTNAENPSADRHASAVYRSYYSTSRLRRLAERLRGSQHTDLYQVLTLVMDKLGSTTGCPELGLPALGSFLFSPNAIPDLQGAQLANADLLAAVRALALVCEGGVLRSVDYRNLGSEELGSIYESLLELHPVLNSEAGTFELRTASGHERKTTGSYYTPGSLIHCLLDSALDPVLDEAARQPQPESAILNLRICDPACGSGHFLIAAAHRIAKRLAAVRTGEAEPSPAAYRTALRDVIARCLYGVDLNPMAVELCKVALWMEALVPGKPLSFLDHHIQCGNSLLGATPELLQQGIPDGAFEPIEGDDKKLCAAYKKQNRKERIDSRRGQPMFPWEQLGNLAAAMVQLDALPSDSVEQIRDKERRYAELVSETGYRSSGHFLADLWCAAFVWKKTKEFDYPITEDIFRRVERHPHDIAPWMYDEVRRLAQQYQFFHWHLTFPDVFQPQMNADQRRSQNDPSLIGVHPRSSAVGFDVVLGNPPWERIKLQEQEWFAQRRPDIAQARNAAERRARIAQLAEQDPALLRAFLQDRRKAEAESHFVRNSGRYPLSGRGDVNTYALFAETNRSLIKPTGRVGCIVPSGIATDDTTKHFFQDLVDTRALVSLYDFENREGIFPGVHRSYKFCLLTLAGPDRTVEQGAEFAFFLHHTEELADPERRFTLSAEDIALVNPNTRTCPIFRTRRDAELTKAIYRVVPVLVKEGPPEENPWGVKFLAMLHMANDSHLFRTREQLEKEAWRLQGNVFRKGQDVYLPLYEAKMLHQFDHRWATYDQPQTRDVTAEEKRDPNYKVQPRYWVPAAEVEQRLEGKWDRRWLLGWRDICRNTDERTVIASILPRVGVGHTCPLMLPNADNSALIPMLYANLSSFVLDFAARQKIGGTHLTYLYLKQLSLLPPQTYARLCPWVGSTTTDNTGKRDTPKQPKTVSRSCVSSAATYSSFLVPRVLELVYTAWDLQPFAEDCGYRGPPFRWDVERRFLLRCELDAAFFHLYGISRDDAAYILDTFPIVRRKDEQQHGEYRTKRVILEIYDELAESARTGRPYQTRLRACLP